MIKMEHVIILTHTQIEYDSRIRRQLRTLSKKYNIILCCKKGNGENLNYLPRNIQYFFYDEIVCQLGKRFLEVFIDRDPVKMNYLTGLNGCLKINLNVFTAYEAYRVDLTTVYKQMYDYIQKDKIKVHCIIANDVFVLPMAIRIKNFLLPTNPNVKLIGDMHEIHFDYIGKETDLNQKVRTWLCDTFLPKCDLITSVSEWGVKLYATRYPKNPVACIRNVAEYSDINPKKNGEYIRLVHVGNAQKARRIEEMIKLMELLDKRFVLDMYLVSSNTAADLYINDLSTLIQQKGLQNRIRILSPVVSEHLIQTINDYDIGIFYIEPIIGNHKYILPNKLFEFIQGRVAVVTTPVFSMKEIIETYEVGKVSQDYSLDSFANAIMQVEENLSFYKDKSHQAAKILNTEKEWNGIMNYLEN